MNEHIKAFITKIAWCTVILFVLRCIISREMIATNFSIYDLYGFAGEVIGLTVIIATLYERWLWRYMPFESTPKLFKEYEGIFNSDYDSVERSARLEIKQTLLTVHVTLITGESRSKSISSSINIILNEKQLTYCYLNTPNAMMRSRSEIHYGTAMLCIENPYKIHGQYFTDRKTTGDMKFTKSENNTSTNTVVRIDT
jgi:hypothetical protein